MASPANVTDLKALTEFRSALVRFSEDSRVALTSPGTNAGKVLSWLRHERLAHWKREIRVRSEDAVRANTKLIELSHAENPRPTVEARQAYEAAKRRVKEAEEKQELTHRWIRKLEKEIETYRMSVQPMAGVSQSRMDAAVGRLDGFIRAMDEYVSIKAPGGTGGPSGGAASSAAGTADPANEDHEADGTDAGEEG